MKLMALNISWNSHTTNIHLYQDLLKVTAKIKYRRIRLADPFSWHPTRFVFWQSTERKRNRGRQKMT